MYLLARAPELTPTTAQAQHSTAHTAHTATSARTNLHSALPSLASLRFVVSSSFSLPRHHLPPTYSTYLPNLCTLLFFFIFIFPFSCSPRYPLPPPLLPPPLLPPPTPKSTTLLYIPKRCPTKITITRAATRSSPSP